MALPRACPAAPRLLAAVSHRHAVRLGLQPHALQAATLYKRLQRYLSGTWRSTRSAKRTLGCGAKLRHGSPTCRPATLSLPSALPLPHLCVTSASSLHPRCTLSASRHFCIALESLLHPHSSPLHPLPSGPQARAWSLGRRERSSGGDSSRASEAEAGGSSPRSPRADTVAHIEPYAAPIPAPALAPARSPYPYPKRPSISPASMSPSCPPGAHLPPCLPLSLTFDKIR